MDAHANEYAAAVDGMNETYGVDPFANIPADDGSALEAFCGAGEGSPSGGHSSLDDAGRLITTWLPGEWVQANTPDGESRRVLVIEVLTDDGEDSEYHVAAHVPGKGRQHWAVKARDITIF